MHCVICTAILMRCHNVVSLNGIKIISNTPKVFCGTPKGHFFAKITRKEVETKRIGKEIKTMISRSND